MSAFVQGGFEGEASEDIPAAPSTVWVCHTEHSAAELEYAGLNRAWQHSTALKELMPMSTR
jgi:hypothetical protein